MNYSDSVDHIYTHIHSFQSNTVLKKITRMHQADFLTIILNAYMAKFKKKKNRIKTNSTARCTNLIPMYFKWNKYCSLIGRGAIKTKSNKKVVKLSLSFHGFIGLIPKKNSEVFFF